MRLLLRPAAAAILSVGALIGTASQAAFAIEKVRILIPVRSIDEAFSPFVVAKEKGYFAAEGYDVQLIAVGGSNESAIQVASGNAEVGAASPGEAIVGIQSSKLDIKYFFDLYYANIWHVAVPSESLITSVAELKGKRIGVQSMGSAGTTFGRAFVQAAGLNPQTDITFLPIGVGAQAITTLRQKLVDAAIYWDAAIAKFKFSGLDLRDLPTSDKIRSLPDVGLLARNDVIAKNPAMLAGVARAIAKGYDFSMANPEAAVAITWKAYPEAASKNSDVVTAMKEGIAVNQARLGIWNSPKTEGNHGLFITDDWQQLIDFFVDQKVIPAPVPVDRVVTNTLIVQINAYDRTQIIAEAKADHTSLAK